MKLNRRFAILILLGMIYCFIAIFCSISTSNDCTSPSSNHVTYKENSFFYYVTPYIISPIDRSESSVNSTNNFPSSPPKNSFNENNACSTKYYRLLNRSFSRHIFTYLPFEIKFPDTDIIFPFHTFW